MELLVELLAINESADLLSEDLGNLKQLGLGRMAKAFKQNFRLYDPGRRGYNPGPRTSPVGKKLQITNTWIGPNSEIIPIKGNIKNWGTIKKAYRDNAEKQPGAATLFVDGKACVLIIGDIEKLSGTKQVFGVAYDFTGLLDEDEVKPIANVIDDLDDDYGYKIAGEPTKRSARQGGRTTQHYEGVGVTHKNMNAFIDAIVAEFPSRVTGKIITQDAKAKETIKNRKENQPIDPTDVKLFKDDIETRLKKYKLSKVESVDDVKTLVDRIFGNNGQLKKIKFAGETYLVTPGGAGYYSSRTDSGSIERLWKGEEVELTFQSDQMLGANIHKLLIKIKLSGMQIVPVSIRYRDFSSGSDQLEWKEEKF